jgi:prepilin-type N-terminal cleavage/methylation domain-containing protein
MRAGRGQTRAGPGWGGFSLVEVMCALAILAVGLVGMTEGISTALRSARDAERHTAAAWYAAGVIELTRTDGYLRAGVTEGECVGVLPGCRWRQTLQEGELGGLFEVTVTIVSEGSEQPLIEVRTRLFEAPWEGGTPSRPDRRRQEGMP